MKKIVLTGGGTAGHVTPNIALLPSLIESGYQITYIGSYEGIEKSLMEDFEHIKYLGISTGKLRRYFDLKNFTDPFRVIKGYFEAKSHLKNLQPDVVFSKGGFVSVPVIRAAAKLKIPCILHESDITPGLANRLCIPVAQKICCAFPETYHMLPKEKTQITGTPIRKELLSGSKTKGLSLCGFTEKKPVLMVIGGSLGAANINKIIRDSLPKLLENFQIVHLCGKGKIDTHFLSISSYKQFEYLTEELKDIFAASDLVISRAGANSICELLALKKPNILIPLPSKSSRGDQLLNAKSFESQGFSVVLDEEFLTSDSLVLEVEQLYKSKDNYILAMEKSNQLDSTNTIIDIITKISLPLSP